MPATRSSEGVAAASGVWNTHAGDDAGFQVGVLTVQVLFMILFFFVAFFIIGFILLQEGKGGGLAAMGGGAMDSVMGGRNPLRMWTVYLAIAFVLLTFAINYTVRSSNRLPDAPTPPPAPTAPTDDEMPVLIDPTDGDETDVEDIPEMPVDSDAPTLEDAPVDGEADAGTEDVENGESDNPADTDDVPVNDADAAGDTADE